MSGQTLNDLLATVFSRAADPPTSAPPHASQAQASSSSSSSTDLRAPSFPSSSTSSPHSSADPAIETLTLLSRAKRLSDSLSIISENDSLRDISTSSLRILFLDSLQSELEQSVRTFNNSNNNNTLSNQDPHSARKLRLAASQDASRRFIAKVLALGVVPQSTSSLVKWLLAPLSGEEKMGLETLLESTSDGGLPTSTSQQTPHVREVKIALFKLERSLKSALDEFRKGYAAKKKFKGKTPSDPYYDLLLYPTSSTAAGSDDEEDEEEEERDEGRDTDANSTTGGIASVRQYLLALLNLHLLQCASSLQSASQELQLLRSMPPPPPPSLGAQSSLDAAASSDPSWRLDRPLMGGPGSTSGPLMNPEGKVLRPFTITSNGTNKNREDLKSEVFRPSYRLPTMSIDEYLEEEQRRGNIIQGGGQASYDAPTTTEQLQRRMQNDGTKDAEDAEEEQRQKDLHWDEFTENNRKGAGNTMNRG